MGRNNTVKFRLSDEELKALKDYAKSKDVPMSDILRDFVKSLIKNPN